MSRSRALRYAAAILLPALAQLARLWLQARLLSHLVTFVPFILVAAVWGGLGPGLLSTVLCVLEADYFDMRPLGSLRVADPENWFRLGDLALTGAGASVLMAWLRRSAERQRAAFLELATIQGNAPIMMLLVDQALRVRKANPLAVQFAGRNVPEILGLGPGGAIGCLNALADPEGCGHSPACANCVVRQSISDTVRNGLPHFGVEAWVPVSAESRETDVCLLISTVPMQLEGKGKTVLVCAQDITAHKLAAAEILEQRDILGQQARLIDLSHDAIIRMDAGRVITGWNTGAQEMYGWREVEARGQVTHTFLQTTAPQSTAEMDTILRQSGHWDGELVHSRRDGMRIVVDSRQVLQRDSGGHPAGILEINRDITERKRAETELREAHRKAAALLESISDGFNAFDREWRCTYVNSTAARMVHKTPEELVGRRLPELWPHAADSAFGEAYRRAVEQNVPLQVEGFYPEPLNAWFEVRCYPTPDGLSLFFTDITERKRADQEIHDLNLDLERRVHERTAQLEAANQDLEAFAYTVSHDLRAPLRGIDGWSLALEQDYGNRLGAEGGGYLERVRSEARRMGHLIDDLLEFSRVTRAPLNRQLVDLTEVARGIAAGWQESQPERAMLFVVQPGLAAQGDAHLLEAALANLLGNSVKFTGKCAEARIEFGRTELGAGHAFYVHDNGAGFDMASAALLFEAFQRLHSASEFPGTGIGLATVKRIIERHGGRIWAESQPGQGATFFFTLG